MSRIDMCNCWRTTAWRKHVKSSRRSGAESILATASLLARRWRKPTECECELAYWLVFGGSVRRYSGGDGKAAENQHICKAAIIACPESIVTPSWTLIHNL